jgi:tRNA (guanine10-N2)-dimethyltransferase
VPFGGRLLDPFCGTGAIVAEASLIGLKAVGSDLSDKMVEGARRNLAHLKARAELRVSDVGDILGKIGQVEGIATDPPYGRSTSTNGEKIPALYGRAFNAFEDVLERRSRVAIVVPDLELLEGVKGFRLLETHNLWVHRSLTRRFCLLEKL